MTTKTPESCPVGSMDCLDQYASKLLLLRSIIKILFSINNYEFEVHIAPTGRTF